MKTSYPGNRVVTWGELVEPAIIFVALGVLTALGTWAAGPIGVPIGWRLAAGACAAVLIVGSARLAYYRRRPTLRWVGTLAVLWALIMLHNAIAEVRFW